MCHLLQMGSKNFKEKKNINFIKCMGFITIKIVVLNIVFH